MRTNLAYISNRFSEAVAAELANPQPSEASRQRAAEKITIAGFQVHDGVRSAQILDEGRAERKKQAEDYVVGRADLAAQLAARDVRALAYLPKAAWRHVCAGAGIIMLPKGDGTLALDLSQAVNHIMTAVASKRHPENHSSVTRAYVKSLGWNTFLRQAVSGPHSKTTVKISLPPPPPEVVSILLRVKDMNPLTAAVPDAIMFSEGVETVIARAVGARIAEEKRQRDLAEWMRHDPIVYVENDHATAIVAQFGDFPIEQEVVDRASRVDFIVPVETRSFTGPVPTRYASGGVVTDPLMPATNFRNFRAVSPTDFVIVDSAAWTGK